MPAPSVTYSFSNSTTADATQVNTNFTDLINGASDGTKDYSISALTCAGTVTLNGNVTLGNASGDDITVTGSIAATIPVKANATYNFGSATLGMLSYYIGNSTYTIRLLAPSLSASYTWTFPSTGGTVGQFACTDGSGTMSFRYPEKTTSKTTTYTATGDESVILCSASGGSWTLTLPAAASFTGKHYHVKKTDSSTNTVTIDGNAAETIDGATTYVVREQYESVHIVCDGSNWHIIG